MTDDDDERKKRVRLPYHEDTLGRPLYDVVEPGPGTEIEPPHGEEYMHLLEIVRSLVCHQRGGWVAVAGNSRPAVVTVSVILFIFVQVSFSSLEASQRKRTQHMLGRFCALHGRQNCATRYASTSKGAIFALCVICCCKRLCYLHFCSIFSEVGYDVMLRITVVPRKS